MHERRDTHPTKKARLPKSAPARSRLTKSGGSTRGGERRTTSLSARSTCSTTRSLREPLRLDHIKPRLLGHWGTTPGLNFIYAHINRAIIAHGLNAVYVIGPGHGAPGILANTYLEGTYSEVYPQSRRTRTG